MPPRDHTTITFVEETTTIAQQYHVIEHLFSASGGRERQSDVSNQARFLDEDHSNLDVPKSTGQPISNPKDAFYMSRYVRTIGPWFDLFDHTDCHFSYVVPALALNNPLLRLSCLAAAARQYSLVNECGDDDALLYYDEALRTLSSYLNDRAHEPATFASCLLIAHCEMIESKAADWDTHLQGTRQIVVAQGWHGSSGGLAQACFWIYCRMMILSSMSSGRPTPIATIHWLPRHLEEDRSWSGDIWARETVYLLGVVHNFACRSRSAFELAEMEANEAEWENLAKTIRHHRTQCTSACWPLSQVHQTPLEEVCYANGSIAAMWQMFHTLELVHAISKPSPRIDRLSKSAAVLPIAAEHAKQIVANTVFNRFDTAWVNAVQLLTTAGQHLKGRQLQHMCVTALEDIRRTTGWKTGENLAALFQEWEKEKGQG